MKNIFDFDIYKAIEAVLYVVKNASNPTMHSISKALYFADKDHLERYGRLICGDSYVAMKNGPVPSGIYDLFKVARGDNHPVFTPSKEVVDWVSSSFRLRDRYNVEALRDPEMDYLSDSDIECLDRSIEAFDHLSFQELTKVSHDKAWQCTGQDDIMSLPHIIETFNNPGDLVDHLQDPHPGEA